jgi:hypothetical protein
MMLAILKETVNSDCRPPQAIEIGKMPAASKICRIITTANKNDAIFAVRWMNLVLDNDDIGVLSNLVMLVAVKSKWAQFTQR